MSHALLRELPRAAREPSSHCRTFPHCLRLPTSLCGTRGAEDPLALHLSDSSAAGWLVVVGERAQRGKEMRRVP